MYLPISPRTTLSACFSRKYNTQKERPVYVRSLMNVGTYLRARTTTRTVTLHRTHTKPLASRGQLDPSVAIIASGPPQRTTSGQAHGSARQASAFPRTVVTRRQTESERAQLAPLLGHAADRLPAHGPQRLPNVADASALALVVVPGARRGAVPNEGRVG